MSRELYRRRKNGGRLNRAELQALSDWHWRRSDRFARWAIVSGVLAVVLFAGLLILRIA